MSADYLMKSRHGVWYFRVRVPKYGGQPAQLRPTGTRELRVSLRTKNKKAAHYLALKKWLSMQDQLTSRSSLELEADREFATYKRGKALLAQHPGLDPHDRFAREELSELLPTAELEALIFAFEHDERQEVRRRLRHTQLEQHHAGPHVAHRDPGKLDGPLADAVRRFLDHKAPAVRPKTLQAYATKCQLFCAVLADANKGRMPLVSEITAQRVQDYADIIRKLPKNFSLAARRPIGAALRGTYVPIDAKTRNFHFATIRDFLRWAEQQHYAVRADLGSIFGSLKTKSTRKRVPFPLHDLERIFHAKAYTRGTFKRSSEFWVPLLGLFTGAREAELCQLHVADIYQDEATSIWVIDINQSHDKTLKSGEQNERKIPVDGQLAALGFLEFVELMRARGCVRLFPDEARNGQGEFSAFSKRFNRYRESVGVVSDGKTRKDFHSFRHNVSTFLVDHACPDYVINSITGHSQSDQSLAVKLYATGGVGLKRAAEWIAKLDYGVDWSVVRKNGWRKPLAPGPQQ